MNECQSIIPDIELLKLEARIVSGEKGIVFIYPRLLARVPKAAIHVFSVEIDGMELLPSTKVPFPAGETEQEIQPVRIVNPTGDYTLNLKLHTGTDTDRAISAILAFD